MNPEGGLRKLYIAILIFALVSAIPTIDYLLFKEQTKE